MNDKAHPADLTEAELKFTERLKVLFARVDAQKPEKGINELLRRARKLALQTDQPIETVLEQIYRDAEYRTEKRIQLLSQCTLKQEQ